MGFVEGEACVGNLRLAAGNKIENLILLGVICERGIYVLYKAFWRALGAPFGVEIPTWSRGDDLFMIFALSHESGNSSADLG